MNSELSENKFKTQQEIAQIAKETIVAQSAVEERYKKCNRKLCQHDSNLCYAI